MQIDSDLIEQMLEDANEYVILNDRSLFDPFFIAFEEYCIEHGATFVLMSAAYSILKDSIPTHDNYTITICVNRPFDFAVAAANHLTTIVSRHIDPRKISITKTANDCTISVNTRQCFKIYRSPMFRDTTVDSLVGTVEGHGLWTGKTIKCQNVYSLLGYLLSQSYDQKGKIDNAFIKEIIETLRPIIKEGSKDHQKKPRKNDRSRILEYLLSREGVYRIPSNKPIEDRTSVPSFVIDAPFEDVRKELEKQFTIRVMKYNLYDLDDFALMKFVIHDVDEYPVCAVYNSMEHQVIPIRADRIVCRRYAARVKILEIQMLRMMSHIGRDMSKMIKTLLLEVFDIIDDPKFYDEDDIIGYAGVCINWNVLRKTMGKTKGMYTIFASKNDPAFSLRDD